MSRSPGIAPHRVTKPIMRQRWSTLTYAHWRYPAAEVQQMLPPRLTVDAFDGSAWVGLVPFRMEGIAAGFGPAIPYFGTFPETNVRTYVVGPDGPGVWFNSLDITRLLPVLVARATYRLPYMWSRMSITQTPRTVRYRSARRWPRPRARSALEVEVGDPIAEPSELDHFLSARWQLYTMLGSRLAVARVEHEPWPLRRASLVRLDDELVVASGYGAPRAEPHLLYSPGVSVRVERPRHV